MEVMSGIVTGEEIELTIDQNESMEKMAREAGVVCDHDSLSCLIPDPFRLEEDGLRLRIVVVPIRFTGERVSPRSALERIKEMEVGDPILPRHLLALARVSRTINAVALGRFFSFSSVKEGKELCLSVTTKSVAGIAGGGRKDLELIPIHTGISRRMQFFCIKNETVISSR